MNGTTRKLLIGAALPDNCLEVGKSAPHIEAMRELGHGAALVTLPWATIEYQAGQFDSNALTRCRSVLEALQTAGMEPVCVLSDGTIPRWFESQGGWASSKAAEQFTAYAVQVADILAPFCQWWVPISEPEYGLTRTYHEKGLTGYRNASTQMVCAHRDSSAALRSARSDANVGLSVRVFSAEPADIDSPWDLRAARRLEHRLSHRMADRLRDLCGREAFDFALASWGGVVTAGFSPGQWIREWVTTLDEQGTRISLRSAHRNAARFDEAMSALLGYQTPLLVLGESEQPSTLHSQVSIVARRCAEEGGERVAGFLFRGHVDREEWQRNIPLLQIKCAEPEPKPEPKPEPPESPFEL